MRRPGRPGGLGVACACLAILAGVLGPVPAAGGAGPALLGCDQAGARLQVTASVALDPSCTWTAGIDVTGSGLVLDCHGALVAGPGQGVGILVHAPVDAAQHDVTVRNCRTDGFTNGIRISRDGFRDLAAGVEYDHGTADITVEDSQVTGSRGVGVFVDGYVTGVTLRGLDVEGAGSSGIYLEGGSKGSVVAGNRIVGNGFRQNGAAGQETKVGGSTFRFWGPGREGISVDGSSGNRIAGNHIWGNSAGGVFLYKNCGEYPGSGVWFERRTPAADNVIEGNDIGDGRVGVWVASRMGENTLVMGCTDPAYRTGPAQRIVLDRAPGTTVTGNSFTSTTYGVRVEDDDTTVEGNTFRGATTGALAVLIGTRFRTADLQRPVRGTIVRANTSTLSGSPWPYRWDFGQEATTFAANTAGGIDAVLCRGVAPKPGPFVMVWAVAVVSAQDPDPQPPDPLEPPPPTQPPCARSTGPTTTTSTTTNVPVPPPARQPVALPEAAPAEPVATAATLTG